MIHIRPMAAASRRRALKIAAPTAAALCVIALSACGSSNTPSTASSTPSSSPAAASTTNAAATSGVATATKYYTPYLAVPQSINVTSPLKSPAPTGKSIVFLGTPQSQNVQIQQATSKATSAIGWNYSEISYDPANPSTFLAAVKTAIARHPNFIEEAGLPASLLSPSIMSSLKAGNIKVVTNASNPELLNSTVLANPDSIANGTAWGKLMGEYFVAHSNGTGNVLIEHVPAYSILDGFTNSFKSVVASQCPKCKVQEVDITLPQLAAGSTASLIVAALRRSPSVNYLVFDDAPFADGITQALSAAGRSHQVKILGQGTDPDALAGLRNGTELAWTGYDSNYDAYQAIDAMARSAEGMAPNPQDNVQPTQLLTSANVGSQTDWIQPATALAQFTKLWKQQ